MICIVKLPPNFGNLRGQNFFIRQLSSSHQSSVPNPQSLVNITLSSVPPYHKSQLPSLQYPVLRPQPLSLVTSPTLIYSVLSHQPQSPVPNLQCPFLSTQPPSLVTSPKSIVPFPQSQAPFPSFESLVPSLYYSVTSLLPVYNYLLPLSICNIPSFEILKKQQFQHNYFKLQAIPLEAFKKRVIWGLFWPQKSDDM